MAASRKVVFHCPACGTDRLGRVRRGRWSSWLYTDNAGTHVSCTGCEASFHPCTVSRGVTGTSYRALLNDAVRAMAAAVVAVSDSDPRVVGAGLEFVRALSSLDYSHQQLRRDVNDPRLEHRLRGDLTLLATTLAPQAAADLVDQLRRSISAAGSTNGRQKEVVDRCGRYLGVAP
jgi:transcription elongation factor Elf1